LKWLVEVLQDLLLVVEVCVELEVDGPAGVVGVEESDLGVGAGAGEGGAGLFEVGAELLDFGVERERFAAGADDGSVVLFLSV
jgi:hypothetical protein